MSHQEIRDCVYRGSFSKLLEDLAKNENFRKVVKLPDTKERDGTREECVLRFFAFFDRYRDFQHSVRGFLNTYMEDASREFREDRGKRLFAKTFAELEKVIPGGLRRKNKRSTTPLNLFEGVAVGAALAVEKTGKINGAKVDEWMGSDELLEFTTQATNDKKNVIGRIEYCRDRFLEK